MTTPAEDEHSVDERSLGRRLRRTQAIERLPSLLAPASAGRLILDGRALEEFTPCASVIIRAVIEHHVTAGTGQILIVEPTDSECWGQMSELLMPLPADRWAWAGTRSASARLSDVFLPATVINDADAGRLASQVARMSSAGLGAPPRAPGLIQEAVAVFLDNAREHAKPGSGPPVVCAARHRPAKELEVACFNLEAGGASITDANALRAAMAAPFGEPGSLADLTAIARGGLDFCVRLAAGTGRATRPSESTSWSWGNLQHSVPGFLAALEIKYVAQHPSDG